MLATAVRLFQRDGYHATSWRRLVDEAGTPWGSAHHHFPGGKEQLGVEAVQLGADFAIDGVRRGFERHDSPEDAIRWWYRKAGRRLADADYRGGCPLATITLETVNGSPKLTAACREAFDRWQGVLTELLREHGYAAEAATELAVAIIHNFEGALLLSRVRRDTNPLELAAEQIAVLLAHQRHAAS